MTLLKNETVAATAAGLGGIALWVLLIAYLSTRLVQPVLA